VQLDELHRRKDRVVDAYLHEGKLDEATYREQRQRLEQDENEVRQQLHAALPADSDLEGALQFASCVLSNPAGCWERLAPAQRPGFQQAVYPKGLTYRDGGFGTAETSWAFSYLQNEMNDESRMASPAGVEPELGARHPFGHGGLRASELACSVRVACDQAADGLAHAGLGDIPGAGPRCLRRTWATVALDMGHSAAVVQSEGGWASPQVLLDAYARPTQEQRFQPAIRHRGGRDRREPQPLEW